MKRYFLFYNPILTKYVRSLRTKDYGLEVDCLIKMNKVIMNKTEYVDIIHGNGLDFTLIHFTQKYSQHILSTKTYRIDFIDGELKKGQTWPIGLFKRIQHGTYLGEAFNLKKIMGIILPVYERIVNDDTYKPRSFNTLFGSESAESIFETEGVIPDNLFSKFNSHIVNIMLHYGVKIPLDIGMLEFDDLISGLVDRYISENNLINKPEFFLR